MSKLTRTPRGFAVKEFKDHNGKRCSIQKSSLATAECIWLGISDPEVQVRAPIGWKKLEIPGEHVIDSRMHLTRAQVRRLLPLLQKFVDTGDIR